MSEVRSRTAFEGLRCIRCGYEVDAGRYFEGCPKCTEGDWAANLEAVYDLNAARRAWEDRAGRGVWRYAGLMPVRDPRAIVTMGEGATPLIPVEVPGLARALVKNEGVNPTWSYKDRLCSVAVTVAREMGARVIAVSSTGNHGASAAAYAARAGLDYVAFTREDIEDPTLAFMQAYGGAVLKTSRLGRWELLKFGVREFGWHSVSTYTPAPTGNPFGLEGYKTIAFELFEELGRVPDVVAVPTCYGEGLTGVWAGFELLHQLGLAERTPRMVAAEPAGGAPLWHTLNASGDRVERVPPYTTVATSIGATAAGDHALHALRLSGGAAIAVTDEEILTAQRELAYQGMLTEPSGAAAFATLGRLQAALPGFDPRGALAVALVTAGGLREVSKMRTLLPAVPLVEPTFEALEQVLAGVARTARVGDGCCRSIRGS